MNNLSYSEQKILRGFKHLLEIDDKMPGIQKLMKYLELNSTRGTVKIINSLVDKGYIKKGETGRLALTKTNIKFTEVDDYSDTIAIPLLGEISCGLPLLANQNIETYIKVSTAIAKPNSKYFFLKATGMSMNMEKNLKPINSGDLVLIKVQNTADPGQRIVALIDNEATIKAYYPKKDHILLSPRTTEINKYHPIILKSDFKIQGVVVEVFHN